jgi:DNA-directed RNA polymerase specialized sigma24 family protein
MLNHASATAFYERQPDRLLRQVSRYTPASPETVEDACAFAWLQWARLRPDQSRASRWLFLVAWREARRLHHIEARDADRTVGLAASERLEDRRLDPEPSVALRDALARLRPRQRRLLTMQAAGLTYGEMAAATGARSSERNAAGPPYLSAQRRGLIPEIELP